MIIIESKRKKIENIRKKYPDAIIADVTSQAKDGLVRLSPFYLTEEYRCLSVRVILPPVWKAFGRVSKCLKMKILTFKCFAMTR